MRNIHYSDKFILKLTNAALEYVLLMATYFFSGYVRQSLPSVYINPFSIFDLRLFLPMAVIFSTISVGYYALSGDYITLHFSRMKAMILKVIAVQTFAIICCTAYLFMTEGFQLSRVYLVIELFVSVIVMVIKRAIFHHVANRYLQMVHGAYKELIIGSGDIAKRYYKELTASLDKSTSRYVFAGYVANHESHKMSGYMGDLEDFPSILGDLVADKKVDDVIIADETITMADVQKIMANCGVYGINCKMIPVFNDYISNVSPEMSEMGLYLYTLNMSKTIDILGVKIAVTNMEKTISDIQEHLDDWRGRYICVSNVHTTVMAHDSEQYREIQNRAAMALPDGGPLSSYSRKHGAQKARRVTGPDLMKELLARSSEGNYRHFFYGSSEETLSKLKDVVASRYPDATIAGMISPPFREITAEEDRAHIEQINSSNPDFLWVGLGAPKQEIWMAAHEGRVNCIMIGVGAAFDYEAGNIKRAPKWMQKLNLEWLYRLVQSPKKLFKRYISTNFKFLWMTRK